MRAFRRLLFWVHLTAGVVAGAVVLIMSVTGGLLTYQRQLTWWADTRGLDGAAPAGVSAPLPVDSLLALSMTRNAGKAPTAVIWRRAVAMPIEIQYGRVGREFVNAYTGDVLGTGNAGVRRAFSLITEWHRWLAMSGDGRATGKRVTGAANLAFLLLVLTGAYLWFPRLTQWKGFRQRLWFRRGLSSKARDFNWHAVIGVWSVVPLVVIVASGVVISYGWAGNLVYRLAGETPPAPAGEAGVRASVRASVGAAVPGATRRAAAAEPRGRGSARAGGDARDSEMYLGDVRTLAGAHVPSWRSVSLAWPKSGNAPLVYTIDRGSGGEPHKRGTLTVSRSGEVERWQPFASQTPGRRARSLLRFLHTGEALGIVGQTIAGLVSFGAALLVYTGLALSLRRTAAWWRRRARERAVAPAPAVASSAVR
jgi:uncharacterized iron-regulated membrane protein